MPSVIKANGEVEQFSEEKVLRSIRRAGIPHPLQQQVLSHIKRKVYNNMPTSEVYHHITEFLGKSENPYARSSYSLKQAIMLLGPTGYPFEDFIAVVLHAYGFHTKVRQLLHGKCVIHEVDVVATKNNKTVMVEAKFHNNPGIRSDLHVALYTKARFDDVKDHYHLHEAWLVTNTKATSDAIAFAECMNMRILSWQYPAGESLRDLIEQFRLYPVTMLTSLTSEQKFKLLANHIIICRDILANPLLLTMLNLTRSEQKRVLDEIAYINRPHTAEQKHEL